jgi:hypothetical protein
MAEKPAYSDDKHCPATGNKDKKEFILLIRRSEKIIF